MLPRRRGFFDFVFSLSSSLFHSRDDPPVFERAQGHAREYQLHGRGGEPRHVAEEGEKGKEKKGERNDRRCTKNGKIRAAKPCFQSRDSQKESFSFYPSTRLLNAAEYNDGPVRRPPRDGHGSRRGRYSCSAGGGRKGAGRERTRERERERRIKMMQLEVRRRSLSASTLSPTSRHTLSPPSAWEFSKTAAARSPSGGGRRRRQRRRPSFKEAGAREVEKGSTTRGGSEEEEERGGGAEEEEGPGGSLARAGPARRRGPLPRLGGGRLGLEDRRRRRDLPRGARLRRLEGGRDGGRGDHRPRPRRRRDPLLVLRRRLLRGRLLPPAARGHAAAPSSPQAALPGRQFPPGPPRRPRRGGKSRRGERGGPGPRVALAREQRVPAAAAAAGARRRLAQAPVPRAQPLGRGARAPGRPGVAEELGDA